LSRSWQAGEKEIFHEMGRKALRLTVALLPLGGLIAGAAPEIVGFVFGPTYAPAAPLLALLVFGVLAQTMLSVITTLFTAAGKPAWPFAVAGPMLPLALTGHLLLIPRWGAMGAALVTTLVAGLGAMAALLLVYRTWQISLPIATIGRSLLATGLAYLLAIFWPAPGFWLLLKFPAIILLVFLLFVLLGEFSPAEIALVRSMLSAPYHRQKRQGSY